MKKNKAPLTIFSIIAIFVILAFVICWKLFYIGENRFLIAPSYDKADSLLNNNYKELSYVFDELSDLDYDSVSISELLFVDGAWKNNDENKMFMEVERKSENYEDAIPVPDELCAHIIALHKKGVRDISWSKKSARLTIWNTMSESRGIVYSESGAPDGEQLVEVKQLSIDNWYYYVHNYEKAKEMYPERFM